MLKMRNLRPQRATFATAAVVAGVVGGVAGGPSMAWAAALPPVQMQGPVAYLTGGVGQEQAHAIETEAAKWPVMLEFTVKDRQPRHEAFLSNVAVQILDAKKTVVLDTHSDGPFVLARLQPGRYEVKATFDGRTMTRTMHVAGKATAREVFVWPHGAEKAGG